MFIYMMSLGKMPDEDNNNYLLVKNFGIFSRQASLARQTFLITPLHGARYKTGKNAYAKK